jgi:hypothetical protein
MHNKTKRNDRRRINKHLRKECHDFCYTVKNLKEEESIDCYIEKIIDSNPQLIQTI